MANVPVPMPPPTIANLVPPAEGYPYFARFERYPFEAGATGESTVNAWWLAEISMLVYGDEAFVNERLGSSGVAEAIGTSVTFFHDEGRTTQGVAIEADGFAVLAFRGTRVETFADPLTNLKMRLVNIKDLVTDIDVRLDPDEHVHAGFKRALDGVWGPVASWLDGLRVRAPEKPVWLTGHSLGGALATVAARRLGPGRAAGLDTFGAPRVGDSVFRADFRVPCRRYVNNTDVVPHVPPSGLMADYGHVGELRFIDRDGRIASDPAVFEMLESQWKGHVDVARAGFERLSFPRLKEAGRAVIGAVRRGEIASVGDTLDFGVLPVAAVAEHAPIYYALRLRNALPDRSVANRDV